MIRRALGVVALAAIAACGGSPGGTAPTTLPPTTRVPAPISPTGVADRVRTWVQALDAGKDDVAFAALGPTTRAVIGGRDGYAAVRRGLTRTWGRWASVEATYDALPLGSELAVVVVHATPETGPMRAAAVPMRVVDGAWVAEPLLDPGNSEPVPGDRSKIAPLPDLAVEIEAGMEVRAFVDQQPAEVGTPSAPRQGTERVPYRPSFGLRPGWHLVTFVFTRGDTTSAEVVRYEVPEPA